MADSLYKRLGGYDGIAAFADNLLPRLMADPRLGRFRQHRGEDGVRREKQLLDRDWPVLHEQLEELVEAAAVLVDMKATVVAEVERAVAQCIRQRGAVIVPLLAPPQIVHAQTVHEHQDLRVSRRRPCGGGRRAVS